MSDYMHTSFAPAPASISRETWRTRDFRRAFGNSTHSIVLLREFGTKSIIVAYPGLKSEACATRWSIKIALS